MNTTTVTTPSELEIRVERIFDAPRAHVFSVWTDPALIPEWWGDGTVVEQMDVRPGRDVPLPHRLRHRRRRVPRGRRARAARTDVPEPPADARVRGSGRPHEADADDALRDDRGTRHDDAVRRRGRSEGRLRARGRGAAAATDGDAKPRSLEGRRRACTGKGTDERKEGHAEVRQERDGDRQEVRGIHGRRTSRDEGARPRVAQGGGARRQGQGGRPNATVLAKIAEVPQPRIAPWPSGSTRSSKPARGTSRRRPGTGCPHMPRTARSSATSRTRAKFKSRYATFGFSDEANLDAGAMWPTSFALKELTAADEKEDRRAREERQCVELLEPRRNRCSEQTSRGPADSQQKHVETLEGRRALDAEGNDQGIRLRVSGAGSSLRCLDVPRSASRRQGRRRRRRSSRRRRSRAARGQVATRTTACLRAATC